MVYGSVSFIDFINLVYNFYKGLICKFPLQKSQRKKLSEELLTLIKTNHEQQNNHYCNGKCRCKKSVGLLNKTAVTITFDPENENPPEFQKAGWQSILNNFKKYTEEN